MNNFVQLAQQADQARTYITITQEMGPSEQLLSFINHDGSLGSEIGLESFDSFSLETRHELLLSKLNPDQLDQLACEGLLNTVIGLSKRLLGSELILPLIFMGGVYMLVDHAQKSNRKIIPYVEFERLKAIYEKSFSKISTHVANIPTSFDIDKWKTYSEQTNKLIRSFPDDFLFGPRFFKEAGWDSQKYTKEAHYVNDAIKKCTSLEHTLGDKLKSIGEFIKSDTFKEDRLVAKYVAEAIHSYSNTTNELKSWVGYLRRYILELEHFFKPVKD